ncbi:MAG TPA: type II secretion system protein GspJ, partial [Polyangiales bacterium]|nr:type II secretion system protein GspJ [Polyangiales bacterium]
EIMVSLSILAIMSTLLYEGFVQTSRNKQHIEAQLERSHEIRMGMERIVSELQMAYTSAQRNPSEALRPMITAFIAKQVGDGTRIDFTSFSHRRLYRNAHESDQNELSYFVTNDPHKPSQRVLARREQRRIDNDPTRGGETQVLIENVKSFKVTFLEPLTTEWVETWDTTQAAGQANRLPSQAKIVLTVPNPSGTGPDLKFATRTYLPITYALNFTLYKP